MSAAWERRRADGHVVSTDRARIDFDLAHRWVAAEYWSPGIERDRFLRSLEPALCFGLYAPDGGQIGFARVISDFARMAWLSDLAGMPRWILNTRDAQGLYARFGFEPAPAARFMLRGVAL